MVPVPLVLRYRAVMDLKKAPTSVARYAWGGVNECVGAAFPVKRSPGFAAVSGPPCT